MDFSSAVIWGVPSIGVIAAFVFGLRNADEKSILGPAFAVALVLGIILTMVQIALHSFCVEQAKVCMDRGDVNMSYWFQSFLAIPLYWAAAMIGWRLKR